MKAVSVALFAYNRPKHLSNCIESLRKNSESSLTTVYFFLDGPFNTDDIPHVEQVYEIASSTTGFLEIRISKRDQHIGLSRNIIDGITQVLAKQESVIVVEDDLVVSQGFLRYMNRALDFYRESPQVFSISAYNYPPKILRIPRDYRYDAFFVMRHMCWGWGTWRDRWAKADWNLDNYASLRNDESWKRSFQEVGIDLLGMLNAQMHGEIDSWAIRWTHAHFTHHAVCLVPVESLVNNMGADGSGVHATPTSRYFHQRLNGKSRSLRLPSLVYVDPLIARVYKTAERRSFFVRATSKVAKVLSHRGSLINRRQSPAPSAKAKVTR